MATSNRDKGERARLSELTRLAAKMCRVWQRRLRLQDWDIIISVRPDREFPEELRRVYGCCKPVPTMGIAEIIIRDPIDHDDDPFPYDLEQILIHELLHIFWAGSSIQSGNETEAERHQHERAIDTLARTLLLAYGHYGK